MPGKPAFRGGRSLPLLIASWAIVVAWALVSCAPAPDPIEPAQIPTWVSVHDASSVSSEGNEEEHGPSGAMKALDFWGAQRAYPDKTIPDDRYGFALQQARTLETLQTQAVEDGVNPWQPIGPANVGGRTLCLALHPDDPDIIFAGSASGGLWKTTVGGIGADAWDPVDTGFPVLGVSTIAIDPADGNVMYIGTGEAYSYQGAVGGEAIRTTRGSYGVGILKTVDGGITWTPSLDWTYEQSRGVWMVQIHPANSDILYAATTEGVYKTIDAGVSWSLVHGVIMAMDVRIHPTDPDVIFASHGNFGSAGHGIYRSLDAGQNWTKLGGGLPASWTGKTQLAIAAATPDTIFASVANSNAGLGLYKSEDRGDTWAPINGTDYPLYQGWYAHYVVVSPHNSSNLFTGGIEIWRSTNGGRALFERSDWQSVYFGTSPPEGPIGAFDYAHADHHFAVWHPTDPDTVFFASDGGVFRTTDLGDTFESLIGGYQTSQFYNGFSNSAADPAFAMGGLQDNFTVIYEGTNAWRRVIGGDGTWTAMNPLVGSTIYGSAQNLQMARSKNSGGYWTFITPPTRAGDVTAFVAPYVISHDDPTVLYAARSRVYRTDDEGNSWSPTNGDVQLSSGNPVISLAAAESNVNVAYAGTAPIASRARVFTTRNGGVSWLDVTGSLPDRYPSDLTVDPNDPDRVFVTFMGFGTSHVFRSLNGGDTWQDVGAGLPDIPTSAVEIDPDYPEVIYVGTDLGTYFSTDAGASWQPFNNGMQLAMVNDLKVFLPTRKIRAATHGNGAWERDLFEPAPCVEPGEASSLTLFHTGGEGGSTILSWSPPVEPGSDPVVYDTISSSAVDDFFSRDVATCVESDGVDTGSLDPTDPSPGQGLYYLIRTESACGPGTAGSDSLGIPRLVRECLGL